MPQEEDFNVHVLGVALDDGGAVKPAVLAAVDSALAGLKADAARVGLGPPGKERR